MIPADAVLQVTNTSCLMEEGGYNCMLQSVVAAFGGELVAGFVLGSVVVLALYIASSYHPAPPSIGTMLLGGLLIPFLPAQYQGMAQVVILMGFIIGVWVFLRRYAMEVGR